MNKYAKAFIEFSAIFAGVAIIVFFVNLNYIIKGGWDGFLKTMGIVAIVYVVLVAIDLILLLIDSKKKGKS